MTFGPGVKHGGKLKATLDQVVDLLNKQDLVSEIITLRQATPRHELLHSLLLKQQLAEVQRRIAQLHRADLAFVDAVQAFERYDIITAPVVNLHDRVVGMIMVDAVMDYRRKTSERDRLKQVGLNEDEDLFAPIWKSAKNRWAWLAINLVTAFIASRVIGVFEGTIDKLVALAALSRLSPVSAGIRVIKPWPY